MEEKIGSKKEESDKIINQRKLIEGELEGIQENRRQKENFMKEVEKTNILLISKKEAFSKEESEIKEIETKLKANKDLFDKRVFEQVSHEIYLKKLTIEEINKNYLEISSFINSLNINKKEELEKKEKIFKIDICPTCLQDVPQAHKHNILHDAEKKIKNIEKESLELKDNLNLLIKNLGAEKSELIVLEKKKSELEIFKLRSEEASSVEERVSLLKKSRDALKKDIEFLEDHVKKLKESTLEFTKFDTFHKIKEEELAEKIKKERKAEVELAELKKEYEITQKEITLLEKKVMETQKTKEELIYLLETEKWMSEDFLNIVNVIEKNILLTLRKEFSKIFNQWFTILTTDAFYITLDENFTPIIFQGEFELEYELLSGGERTAVALAYRLALNQIINSYFSKLKTQGLVILDEPTDGFSEQQLDKIRDILHELNAKQLIIVSHEQKIEGFVDNIIRIKKEAGFSKVDSIVGKGILHGDI